MDVAEHHVLVVVAGGGQLRFDQGRNHSESLLPISTLNHLNHITVPTVESVESS